LSLHDVVLLVSGATPSTNPLDYLFTLNGDSIAPASWSTRAGHAHARGARSRRRPERRRRHRKDAGRFTLSGVVTIWRDRMISWISVRDSLTIRSQPSTLRLGDDQLVVSWHERRQRRRRLRQRHEL
jgi:hypothetical protein